MGPGGDWCLSDPGYELNGNDSTNGVWNVEQIIKIGKHPESNLDDLTRIGGKFHEKRKIKTRDPAGTPSS